MEQSKQQQIRELTDRLNRCRYEYYNLNAPSLTDAEYDALFDELSMLEKETGFSMTNSPTQTVGCYPAVSALVKTAHPIPLLSLDGLYEHTIYDCPYAGNRTTYSYWSLA